MAEFKKISDTEVVEAPAENDNLVLISEGVVKQVSAAAFAAAAGGGSGGVEPIILVAVSGGPSYFGDSDCTLADGSPVPRDLFEKFLSGTPIYLFYNGIGSQCMITGTAYDDVIQFIFPSITGYSSGGDPSIGYLRYHLNG